MTGYRLVPPGLQIAKKAFASLVQHRHITHYRGEQFDVALTTLTSGRGDSLSHPLPTFSMALFTTTMLAGGRQRSGRSCKRSNRQKYNGPTHENYYSAVESAARLCERHFNRRLFLATESVTSRPVTQNLTENFLLREAFL